MVASMKPVTVASVVIRMILENDVMIMNEHTMKQLTLQILSFYVKNKPKNHEFPAKKITLCNHRFTFCLPSSYLVFYLVYSPSRRHQNGRTLLKIEYSHLLYVKPIWPLEKFHLRLGALQQNLLSRFKPIVSRLKLSHVCSAHVYARAREWRLWI